MVSNDVFFEILTYLLFISLFFSESWKDMKLTWHILKWILSMFYELLQKTLTKSKLWKKS